MLSPCDNESVCQLLLTIYTFTPVGQQWKYDYRLPVCEPEVELDELLVRLVTLPSSLLLPFVSISDGRMDDNFPFEIA